MSIRLRSSAVRLAIRRPQVVTIQRAFGNLWIRAVPSQSIHTRQQNVQFVKSSGAFVRSFSTSGDFTEVVPPLGDSITDAVIVEWVKKVGDYVEEDEVVVILETDKVTVDIRANKAGVIKSVAAEEGATVDVGTDLLVLDTTAEAPAKSSASAASVAPATPATPGTPATPTTPVTPAAPATPASAAKTSAPAAPAAAPATTAGSRNETSVPLSRMRMTIARRLKEAQNTAASLTTFNEIDMHNIMALRSKYKEEFEKVHGTKLGFMSAFVKASSFALMKNPSVNAFFDEENKCATYRDYVDISVAVATPTGLVTPVLRNCETLSFAGVESGIVALGKKARDGKISMEDMVGGTFTISNGGVYGSLMGTPILNPPQSAVLGMHGIFKRPVVIDGQIVIRPMMYVALTYDHRIIDGKDAVTFLRDIKNAVEDPARLLLEL